MTVWGSPHDDRSQKEHALLVSSGFAPGPGPWPGARTRVRPRRGLGPGVRPSYFFFGVMGWRGRVDLFPRGRRFGAGPRPPSGLSAGPVSVPVKWCDDHSPLRNIIPLYSKILMLVNNWTWLRFLEMLPLFQMSRCSLEQALDNCVLDECEFRRSASLPYFLDYRAHLNIRCTH